MWVSVSIWYQLGNLYAYILFKGTSGYPPFGELVERGLGYVGDALRL